MSDPNINRPEWDFERAEFGARAMRLGPRARAEQLGATLYEIDPGGAAAPYHLHYGNEELLIVVSGTPQLRTPDGIRALEPGSVVGFPRGAAGAHRVFNPGDEPARVIIVSTMNFPEVAQHVDTGTWLTLVGPRDGKAFRAGTDVTFMDVLPEAMRAGTERDRGG